MIMFIIFLQASVIDVKLLTRNFIVQMFSYS